MVKLLPAVVAIASVSNFTQFAFNASPIRFALGEKYGNPGGYGNYLPGNSVSLLELFNIGQLESNDVPAIEQIRANLMRDGAFMKFVMAQIGITVLSKLARKAGVARNISKLSRAVGTESIVMG